MLITLHQTTPFFYLRHLQNQRDINFACTLLRKALPCPFCQLAITVNPRIRKKKFIKTFVLINGYCIQVLLLGVLYTSHIHSKSQNIKCVGKFVLFLQVLIFRYHVETKYNKATCC